MLCNIVTTTDCYLAEAISASIIVRSTRGQSRSMMDLETPPPAALPRFELRSADSYPSDSPGRWAFLLDSYFEKVMTCANSYTPEEVQRHVDFFRAYVTAWLGPAPTPIMRDGKLSLEALYPSSMTSDHTPLEMSYCWKSADRPEKSPIIVRFVTDIIPADADPSRAASTAAALQTINTLRALSSTVETPLKLSVFPDLWEYVTRLLAQVDRDIHPERSCAHCGSSSSFVGFDLVRSHIKAKLYWRLPSCQTVPELVDLLDRLLTSSQQEGHFANLPSFNAHWGQIRDHLTRNRHSLRPRMLSLDATKHPFHRVKVYSRFYFDNTEPFENVESHLTLGGAISLPAAFLAKCRGFWSCLLDNYRKKEVPEQKGQKFCLILHQISQQPGSDQADSSLSSKLYLFCSTIPDHDAFVAGQLLSRFEGPSSFFLQ